VIVRVPVVFAILLIVPACALAATVDVAVGPGLSFNPSSVTIAPGDTVSWNWAGAAHTSTSDSSTGSDVWNSGLLVVGSFTHTFNTVGNFPYYCSLHSVPGGTFMNGVVNVAAPLPVVTITSVTPSAALPGTTVTITGTGFAPGKTAFKFGGANATGVSCGSSTSCTAVSPKRAKAGKVDVVATVAGKSSPKNPPADQFTYL
jgi:plastocyanin